MVKPKLPLISLLSLLFFALLLQDCKKDDDDSGTGTGTTISALDPISNLQVADVGDAENGSDLQVSFTKVADESAVSAYRVFVVNSSESANFDLEKAESVAADQFFKLPKTGSDLSTTLVQGSKTTSGEFIRNTMPYTIFVMTFAEDPTQFSNSLSPASAEITLSTMVSNPDEVAKVNNLEVVDIGNEMNGSDLQVSFTKVAEETMVKEYQVFVVERAASADFDLEKAALVEAGNLFSIAKTGNDLSSVLEADAKTIDGGLIVNDVDYTVFVMTVAEDPAIDHALSAGKEITLTTKVKVTYIANDGVMIEFEDQKVVIDGVNRASNLNGWVAPSNAALLAVENGDPPYDDIDVIMITHNHGDHYAISAVQTYLSNHPNTKLIVPTSIAPNFGAFASQISNFNVDKFERINIVENGISIDVLHIEHFDQFGNDFSMVESFAYIVTMNDKKFLHAGDIDYIDSQLDLFNILGDDITVAFIPTFGDLVSPANRDALIANVDPDHIICLHFLTSSLSSTLNQVANIYPDAETFTTPFQTIEY